MSARRRDPVLPSAARIDAIANVVGAELGHSVSDGEVGEIAQRIAVGIAQIAALTPSQVENVAFLESIPRERFDAYLLSRGWRHVGTDETNGRDIRWFYHDEPPRFDSKRLTRDDGYLTSGMVPAAIEALVPKPAYLVKTIPAHFGDYVRHVEYLLTDLEHHEDRWRGAILAEIV